MALPTKGRVLLGVVTSVGQVVISSVLLLGVYRFVRGEIGAERFGIWAAVSGAAMLGVVVEAGLGGGTLRYVSRFQSRGRPDRSAVVVESALLNVLCLAVVIIAVATPFLQYVLERSLSDSPPSFVAEARRALPWALCFPVLSAMANVTLSALDALHRVSHRNSLWVIGYLIFAIACVGLVPDRGVEGVAMAQAAQFLFLATAGWVVVRRHLPELAWVPWRWSRPVAFALLRYGRSWQAISWLNLCVEPLFKLFLVRFGGTAFAGNAEFAQRIAMQVRNLAVAAQQALLPLLTQLATQDPARLRGLYVRAVQTSLLLMAAVLPVIWLAGPLGALVWEGEATAPTAFLIQVLAIGALLSTFSLPAYYDFAGRGTLRPNVISLAALATLNASLGWALGQRWGGWGVVAAYLLSTMVSGFILVLKYRCIYSVNFNNSLLKDIFFIVLFLIIFFASEYTGLSNNILLTVLSSFFYYSVLLFVRYFYIKQFTSKILYKYK